MTSQARTWSHTFITPFSVQALTFPWARSKGAFQRGYSISYLMALMKYLLSEETQSLNRYPIWPQTILNALLSFLRGLTIGLPHGRPLLSFRFSLLRRRKSPNL